MKKVTLSEDAYVALAALKKDGERFSDVVSPARPRKPVASRVRRDWKDFPRDKMIAYLSFLEAGDRLSKAKLRGELGPRRK